MVISAEKKRKLGNGLESDREGKGNLEWDCQGGLPGEVMFLMRSEK